MPKLIIRYRCRRCGGEHEHEMPESFLADIKPDTRLMVNAEAFQFCAACIRILYPEFRDVLDRRANAAVR